MRRALRRASRAGIFIILYPFETVEMRFENENFLKVLIYLSLGKVKYFCELIFVLILQKSLKYC